MILAFIAGWILGSFTLYTYLVLTAKHTPYPECMDCKEDSCEGCSTLASAEAERYRLAA